MDEDRLAQAGRSGEQVAVGGIVQRAAIRPPEDHRADVAKLGGAPFAFGRGGLRVASGQGRERAQAVRMRADRLRGLVVRRPGERDGVGGGECLGGGGDDGQDGDVDPGRVHRLDAALSDVLEPSLVVAHFVEGDALVSRPALQAVERVADADAVPVLFDRDGLHAILPADAVMGSSSLIACSAEVFFFCPYGGYDLVR